MTPTEKEPAVATAHPILQQVQQATTALEKADAKRRSLVLQAYDAELSPTEIARAAGVTRGRIHQMVQARRKAGEAQ